MVKKRIFLKTVKLTYCIIAFLVFFKRQRYKLFLFCKKILLFLENEEFLN